MVVNSAADWGKSDPLKVPKTAEAMRAAGFSHTDIERVLFDNPVRFFEQSQRLKRSDMVEPQIDQAELFEGNSVLRGQAPRRS
jgi:uncharacterized protein